MDDNKQAAIQQKEKAAATDSKLYTVDGKAHRSVSERTLRKRLARLASSPMVLILAILVSLSVISTAFSGYMWPVTLFLVIERLALAIGLWMLYTTAGKKGGAVLAVIPMCTGIVGIVGILFVAVFTGSAMFGKLLLVQTSSAVALVRAVYQANLWAVVPILVCITVAYCAYLFYSRERQLLCNLRDGLRYGFPFENGYKQFSVGCVSIAAGLLIYRLAAAIIGSFANIGFVSSRAVAMLDAMLLPQGNAFVGIVCALLEAAVLIISAVLAFRYGATVKKFKAQKKVMDGVNKSARESAEAVISIEKEKAAARAKK